MFYQFHEKLTILMNVLDTSYIVEGGGEGRSEPFQTHGFS